MIGAGSKCLKPKEVAQVVSPPTVTYSCPRALKTRYIRIEGKTTNYVVISQVVAIDMYGNNVALRRPTSASTDSILNNRKNPVDGNFGAAYNSQIPGSGSGGRRYGDSPSTNGWHPADNDSNAVKWWEVQLDRGYELQAVSVFNRADGNTQYMEGWYVKLLDDNRNVIFIFPLTRLIGHNWRLYESNQNTIYTGLGEIGSPNGPLKTKVITIGYKNQFLNINSFEVYTIDYDGDTNPKRYTVDASMITYTIVRNNQTMYPSTDPFRGGVAIRNDLSPFRGQSTESPTLTIRFPSPILIGKIIIRNARNDVPVGGADPNLLNGFVMTLQSDDGRIDQGYASRIWQTTLSSALVQTYDINLSIRQEFGICTVPCPYGYRSERGSEAIVIDSIKCNSMLQGSTDSFQKSVRPRIAEVACRKGIPVDSKRFNPGEAADPRCVEPPARRDANFYRTNLPSGYSSADIDYLVNQDIYSYCKIKGDETLGAYREMRTNTCPDGYSWQAVLVTVEAYKPQVLQYRCQTTDPLTTYPVNNVCPSGYTLKLSSLGPDEGYRMVQMCVLNRPETVPEACPDGFEKTVAYPEVFYVNQPVTAAGTNPDNVCKVLGASVATIDELENAYNLGASWCSCGWMKNIVQGAFTYAAMYPNNTEIAQCGSKGLVNCNKALTDSVGVVCYGIKPRQGSDSRILPFNATNYYAPKSFENTKKALCVKKLPSDLKLIEMGITPEYQLNMVCAQACPDNYSIDTTTRTCQPTAALNTYSREAQKVEFSCPTGTTYDYDYKKCFAPCPPKEFTKGKYCYPEGTRFYDQAGSGVPAKEEAFKCPTGYEMRSDGLCYPFCPAEKIAVPGRCLPPVISTNVGNSKIVSYDVAKMASDIFSLDEFMRNAPITDFRRALANPPIMRLKSNNTITDFPPPAADGSAIKMDPLEVSEKEARAAIRSKYNNNADFLNFPMFYTMAARDSSAPLNLLYNWFTNTPTLKNNYRIEKVVYGVVNVGQAPISQELDTVMSLAERVYLGSPNDIDKFIMVRWEDEKPYIRAQNNRLFFAPEAIQVYNETLRQFEIARNPHAEAQNVNRQEITSDLFACFTGPARSMIRTWVASRTNRIIREKYGDNPTTVKTKLGAYQELSVPSTIKFDISSKDMLNNIAQTFYEYTNGRFIMTYIYDVHTIGTTMIDVRFDMTEHVKDTNDRTRQLNTKIINTEGRYRGVVDASGITQNIVDEAKDNYQSTMADLQLAQSENVRPPAQGAAGRFFYTMNPISEKILFSGMTLDRMVVSSFVRGLNCGIDVPTGTDPGNVNFSPVTRYTKNSSAQLLCSDINTMKRVMTDYVDAVTDPESGIEFPAGTPKWDMSGALVVDEITGFHQINGKPNQCAYSWKETVYDETTHQPVSGLASIQRHAIFTYQPNEEDWYANERVFDLSGFRFLAQPSVERCVWDPAGYRQNVGRRLFGSTDAQALEDYRLLGLRENRSPCPTVNPGYVFDPHIYASALTDATLKTTYPYSGTSTTVGDRSTSTNESDSNTLLKVLKDFLATGFPGQTLSPAFTIPVLQRPMRLTRPLPAEDQLTVENNELCTRKTCEDAGLLYGLVRDYNSDPKMPGIILRVTRVATPGENTCHVEVDIDWSAPDYKKADKSVAAVNVSPTAYATTEAYNTALAAAQKTREGLVATAAAKPENRKGAAKIPVGRTGVQRGVTFDFSVDMDPSDCSYSLAEADLDKGYNIRPSTPALFKPLEFATEARGESEREMNGYVGEVMTTAQAVLDASRQGGLLYRQNTYGAAQSLGGATAAQVQAAGVWPPPIAVAAKRIAADAALREGFQARPTGGTIAPPPIKEVRALDTHAFGRDSARNLAQGFVLQDMYALPLARAEGQGAPTARKGVTAAVPLTPFETAVRNQTLGLRAAALHARPAQVGLGAAANEDARAALQEEAAYKYFRFRCLGTRSPAAEAVSLGRISLFYRGSEIAVGHAKATNPMGDWGGSIADVAGGGAAAGFRDVYKKALVLAFPLPILADGFSFTTARGVRSAAEDPVTWKVEGSHNGTFWQPLHEQLAPFPVPMKRGENLPLFKF
jgi:hypothetical protein